jgi:hypothetical protein
VEWTRKGLEAAGFEGFQRFADLGQVDVPRVGGVYVVLRSSGDRPDFAPKSVAGHFKSRDPSVPSDRLNEAWVDGAGVLYIGRRRVASTVVVDVVSDLTSTAATAGVSRLDTGGPLHLAATRQRQPARGVEGDS